MHQQQPKVLGLLRESQISAQRAAPQPRFLRGTAPRPEFRSAAKCREDEARVLECGGSPPLCTAGLGPPSPA